MAPTASLTVIDAVIVEHDVEFTFDDLCRACRADARELQALVDEGVLAPQRRDVDTGTLAFPGAALSRARTALRIGRDFELDAAQTALVLDMIDQIAELRARLRRAGLAG